MPRRHGRATRPKCRSRRNSPIRHPTRASPQNESCRGPPHSFTMTTPSGIMAKIKRGRDPVQQARCRVGGSAIASVHARGCLPLARAGRCSGCYTRRQSLEHDCKSVGTFQRLLTTARLAVDPERIRIVVQLRYAVLSRLGCVPALANAIASIKRSGRARDDNSRQSHRDLGRHGRVLLVSNSR